MPKSLATDQFQLKRAIAAYRERYEAEDLVSLAVYLKAEGIEPEYKAIDLGGF